eukprot:TRINITY_DN1095_c0_g3_i3.p2 TRINITY_DN1095_c0_g3~~TRINITY_DN1095_c0_g3_i3.p2  ORF type:complete len:160 (+),score=9.77 TRINITY_DN1095_c0_g3_i3:122-601(+)
MLRLRFKIKKEKSVRMSITYTQQVISKIGFRHSSITKKKISESSKGVPKPKPQTQQYKHRISESMKHSQARRKMLQEKRKQNLQKALQDLNQPYEEALQELKDLQLKVDIWVLAYRDIFQKDPNPKDVRNNNPQMYKMILRCGELQDQLKRVRFFMDPL